MYQKTVKNFTVVIKTLIRYFTIKYLVNIKIKFDNNNKKNNK